MLVLCLSRVAHHRCGRREEEVMDALAYGVNGNTISSCDQNLNELFLEPWKNKSNLSGLKILSGLTRNSICIYDSSTRWMKLSVEVCSANLPANFKRTWP